MKRQDVKSQCPINFTVETLGNPWSLLIIRDMASIGKKTFGEFLSSEERIGRSALSERLIELEQKGIIAKQLDLNDRRVMVYSLTEKGLEILPLIYEIARWGSVISPQPKASDAWFAAMKLDKAAVIAAWRRAIMAGDSFEYGPLSVVEQLGLPSSK